MDYCYRCGGPLNFLGALGNLDWFRCEDCGGEQAQERERTELDPASDDFDPAERSQIEERARETALGIL